MSSNTMAPLHDSAAYVRKFVAADWASNLDLRTVAGSPKRLPRQIIFTGGNLNVQFGPNQTTLLDATPLSGLLLSWGPSVILNASTTATAVWVAW